jgi:PST family polysaccharide transporter
MKSDLFNRWTRLRNDPALANFSWLTADKLIRLSLSLVVGTWMARHLGPTEYGTLNYGLAVTAILAIIPTLGLDLIVRRELVQHPERRGVLLGTTFFLKLGAGFATYAATLGGVLWLEPDRAARFVIIMTALMLVQHAVMTIDVHFQAELQARYSVWAQDLAFALSSLGRVVLILAGARLEAFVLMLLLDLPVTSLLLVWFYRRTGHCLAEWSWDGATAWRLLAEAWPLWLGGIAATIFLRADQVLLAHLGTAPEVGRYAAAYRLFELCAFLPVSLAVSLAPGLLAARSQGAGVYEEKLRRFFNLNAQLAWALVLPGIVLAPIVVRVLYGREFGASTPIFAVLLLGFPAMALGVARQQFLVNEGYTGLQLAMTSAGMALSLLLNWALIPLWGGLGAAVASTTAHLVAEVLLSFAWARTRAVARWQLRALVGFWFDKP